MGKNWDWSFKQGRIKRLNYEIESRLNDLPFNSNEIPRHSHDGTMQSRFVKGWQSVTEAEIQMKFSGSFRRPHHIKG
ncbi:hypothetical protein [Pseudoalteromonas umbrosa]|uniref:hypothetical protein n=1 Tax=Pseudoalteromonas umbrosa TaxID=3048489 RepID=UPI0024C32722|nr:hypothetical protein [Pseudoalteromonas sp. B95]MDK1288508.1 hypothetical protein [Pseudoalteromonas sp. B95]